METDKREFETIGLIDGTTLIIGSSPTTYKFLQNLNVYKANLHKNGYTFKVVNRLAEQDVIVKVIPR